MQQRYIVHVYLQQSTALYIGKVIKQCKFRRIMRFLLEQEIKWRVLIAYFWSIGSAVMVVWLTVTNIISLSEDRHALGA